MCIKGVIFDLDGTLLDTLDDIVNFANSTLQQNGFEKKTKNQFRYLAGQGVYNLMKNSSESDDNIVVTKLIDEFTTKYNSSKSVAKPFDYIDKVLDYLVSKSIKIAVLSNKPDGLTKQCVQAHFENYAFLAVFGQQDGIEVKPNPYLANKIADIFSLKPDEIAIIGDTKNDILTAKNGGFCSIGVTWGFREREELAECGATYIVDKPEQICSLIDEINKNDMK